MTTTVKQFSFNGASPIPEYFRTVNFGMGVATAGASYESPNDPNPDPVGWNWNGAQGTWSLYWFGNFCTLGVPAGHQIDSITMDYDWKDSHYSVAYLAVVGPATMQAYPSNSTVGTFSSSTTTTTDTAWTTKSGTAITSPINPATGEIYRSNEEFYLRLDVWTANDGWYGSTVTADWFVITVESHPLSENSASLSRHFEFGSRYNADWPFSGDSGVLTDYIAGASSNNDVKKPSTVNGWTPYVYTDRTSNRNGYCEWSGSLSSLGVPSWHQVDTINLDFDWKQTDNHSFAYTIGPAELRSSGGTLVGTISSSYSGTSTAAKDWSTMYGSAISSPVNPDTGFVYRGSDSAKLRINFTVIADVWYSISLLLDWLNVTVTSHDPGTKSASNVVLIG